MSEPFIDEDEDDELETPGLEPTPEDIRRAGEEIARASPLRDADAPAAECRECGHGLEPSLLCDDDCYLLTTGDDICLTCYRAGAAGIIN